MERTEYYYHKDGSLKKTMYFKGEHVHREGDLPAMCTFYPDGKIEYEYYLKDGKMHRCCEFGCALNCYDENAEQVIGIYYENQHIIEDDIGKRKQILYKRKQIINKLK